MFVQASPKNDVLHLVLSTFIINEICVGSEAASDVSRNNETIQASTTGQKSRK